MGPDPELYLLHPDPCLFFLAGRGKKVLVLSAI